MVIRDETVCGVMSLLTLMISVRFLNISIKYSLALVKHHQNPVRRRHFLMITTRIKQDNHEPSGTMLSIKLVCENTLNPGPGPGDIWKGLSWSFQPDVSGRSESYAHSRVCSYTFSHWIVCFIFLMEFYFLFYFRFRSQPIFRVPSHSSLDLTIRRRRCNTHSLIHPKLM